MIIVNEEDIPGNIRAKQKAWDEGGKVLGLREELPGLLALIVGEKLKKATPNGYRLAEVEMGFDISGQLLGTGISGRAKVKWIPI